MIKNIFFISHQIFFNFLSFLLKIFVRITYPSPAAVASPTNRPVEITLDLEKPLTEVSDRYLSFSIDTSQVLGGLRWNSSRNGREKVLPLDLAQEKLIKLTSALSPAYLRIGGTEADRVIFDDTFHGKNALTLTRQAWDNLNVFAQKTGVDIFFTVNAGFMVRDIHHQWQSTNFEKLLRYSKKKSYTIEAFELGNEINAFWFFHGFRNKISALQYINDFRKFRSIVKKYYPRAKVGGAASIYLPIIGEAFSFVGPITPAFIKNSGTIADMFTWHYYPQQSQGCAITFLKAKHNLLLNPQNLNDIGVWAISLTTLKNTFNPQAELWLGEIGNALCGGQPGISDTFESSLWWTDALGFMATKGQNIIVRQDLVGANYSLLDKQVLNPLPDFWTSLLWKKLMGTKVLQVHASKDNPCVRTYAHFTNKKSAYQADTITIVFINLQNKKNSVFFKNITTNKVTMYQLSAKNLNAKSTLLNNKPLVLVGNKIPVLKGKSIEVKNNSIDLAPLSITYLVFPRTGADFK